MALGLEPAFSRSTTAVWPLAGLADLQPEPDDPDFPIPRGCLKPGVRDKPEPASLTGTTAELVPVALEPLDPSRTTPNARNRKWKASLIASCVFHAAVAFAFIATGGHEILIEGGEEAGLMLLGNAPEDQSAAGDTATEADTTQVTIIPVVDAKPVETVEARPVETVDAVEPVDEITPEITVHETVEPVVETATEAVATPDEVEPVIEEPMQMALATAMPEVLTATTVTPENTENVVAPVVEAVEPETPEVVEAVPQPRPERVTAEAEPAAKPKPAEVKKPEPVKQAAKKPQEKKAPAKPPAKEKATAGTGGKNQTDSKRGVVDGDAQGKTASASRKGSNSSAGNASVSNYPGKVAAKLRRAVRSISRAARSKARSDVHVTFVVNAGGGVGGVSVVRSSGSPELDQAAIAIVRRAAPFPPIPQEAGRSSWSFTLPLGVR